MATTNPLQRLRQITVVPNRRRFAMHVAEALRQDGGKRVIAAPPVVVFSQWVEALVEQIFALEGEAVPLSADAEVLDRLWAAALSGHMQFLADSERMLAARQARAADRLLRHWWTEQAPPLLPQGFWSARNSVSRELANRQMLSPEGWMATLAARLSAGSPLPCELPEKLMFDGFHEITSLERAVLDQLTASGVAIEFAPTAAPGSPPNPLVTLLPANSRTCFASLDEELAAAAHWARERAQSGSARVAVVINGLPGLVESVREVFENVFKADASALVRSWENCPFHITHGEPLANHPLIQDALALLEMTVGGLDRAREFPLISRWLLSPFWSGADTERSSRAQLETQLRRRGAYWLSPRAIGRIATSQKTYDELQENRDSGYRVLLQCIETAGQALAGGDATRLPGTYFLGILQAWGWPGPLARGADAGRCTGQFNNLLEKLDGLEDVSRGSGREALAVLRQMCTERTAVLRGGPLSTIQVVSPEDAAGREFEAAWVANLHAGNWPAQPRANPFLPALAARRIPRSTAEGELAYCQHLTAQLERIAPEVRFSWSRQEGDLPNSVSPLLVHMAERAPEPVPAARPHIRMMAAVEPVQGYFNHPWLRAMPDEAGVPLRGSGADLPAEAIPGGSGMFQDQAICPLLAYFRHRLKASLDDMPSPFADPAYRGALMHSAMSGLYADQPGALGLPGPERVVPAVRQAMLHKKANDRLYDVSFRAEEQRLVRLLNEWLRFEAARVSVSVFQLEQGHSLEFLGHPLSVRLDRIDRLPDGRFMVIDYKSSSAGVANWSEDRLREPQLPLYAVLLSKQPGLQVGAIALATVRGGECSLRGIAADPTACFDQVKSVDSRGAGKAKRFADWDALMAHWEQSLTSLAREIVSGRCANVTFGRDNPALQELDILLRRSEGEAWCLEHGQGDFAGEDEDEAEGQANDPSD